MQYIIYGLIICEYCNLPCIYNKTANPHWTNNQILFNKATMFIGRFYNITFKVMGEMRKFITQEVFLPA